MFNFPYTRTETWIRTEDDARLAASVYEPLEAPRATVLALPGIAVPRSVFAQIGAWLAARGLRLLTVDYRGFGDSSAPKGGARPDLTTWARLDAGAAFRRIERDYPGPILLLAHSFGGQALGVSDDLGRAAAIVMVGSQFGYWKNWEGATRLKVAAFWHVVLPLLGRVYDAIPAWAGLGVSFPSGVGREWARWGRSRQYLLDHVPGARERYAALRMPVRAYSFTDDADFGPGRGVEHLLSYLTGTAVEHRRLAPADLGAKRVGHFGFMRKEIAEPLWEEVLAFFDRALDPDGDRECSLSGSSGSLQLGR